MSGGKTAVPVAAVLEVDGAEPSLDLDLAEAVRAGARAVRFLGAVRLAADEPRATLAAVRLLREAAADGLPVTWNGTLGDGIAPRLLMHLPPPQAAVGESNDASTEEWRRRYRPGLCYYRFGPEFVFVKDVRTPGDFRSVPSRRRRRCVPLARGGRRRDHARFIDVWPGRRPRRRAPGPAIRRSRHAVAQSNASLASPRSRGVSPVRRDRTLS